MPEQPHAHDGLPAATAGRRGLILAAAMMATFMAAVEPNRRGLRWLKACAINGIRRTLHSRAATIPRSQLPPEAPGAHLVH